MKTTQCAKCGKQIPPEGKTCPHCGAPRSAPAEKNAADPNRLSFYPGQILANRYQVVRLIGRGGMGAIYLVHDKVLNENVALKTLLPQFARERTIVERFYNEARIARQLSHPGIVRVHDIGMANQVMYISMEYIQGRSLRAVMEEDYGPGSPVPIATALDVVFPLCEALDYAHRFTVHRDMKPENIMVLPDGTVKIMDFGISKLIAHTRLTMTSMVMGTPQYMSPEQFRDSGSVDARADVYSVGVLLYELLTGELPAGMTKPVSKMRNDVPPAVDAIVSKCLDPDPEGRYQSARELGNALASVRSNLEALEGEAPPIGAPPRTGTVRRVVGVVASLLVAVGAIIAGLAVLQADAGDSSSSLESGRLSETPVAPSADDISLDTLLEQAHARAQARIEDHAEWQAIFDHGERFMRRANDNEKNAVRALQCFAAILWWEHWNPDNSMTFIPSGEVTANDETVDVPGFFADRAPVTNRDYFEFARDQGWHVPAYLTSGLSDEHTERPVTEIPFYYAQAYAAWSGARQVPSKSQWLRLVEVKENEILPPDILTLSGSEWTRTAADPEHTTDPAAIGFGVSMAIGESNEVGNSRLAYESTSSYIGFRCVRPIPSESAVLRALFE